jgi:hypothetical protein
MIDGLAVRPALFSTLIVIGCAVDTGGSDGSFADDESEETEDGNDDGESTGTSGPKFDVPDGNDDGGPDDPCACGASGWSHLWLAQPSEGAVSKIDTKTMQEQARYYTRPDHAGSPSRTSVSLSGRAVAVANRHGGVVKIWGRESLCEDTNGTPGIQTSHGPDDTLEWGEEECVAWYTAFEDYTTQRPVAWAKAEFDEDACDYDQEQVWTAGCGGGPFLGRGGTDGTMVHLLDGETGEVDQSLHMPDYSCEVFGPYGAAVDPDGDLWLTRSDYPWFLAHVDAESFDYEVITNDNGGVLNYGITIDTAGRVWVSGSHPMDGGASVYDPEAGTWTKVTGPTFSSDGGITQGPEGRIWVGYNRWEGDADGGAVWIDPDSGAVGGHVSFGGGIAKGIAFDRDGYLWTQMAGNSAIRLDVDTLEQETFIGSGQYYTYSDMTGSALANTSCEPEG